MKIFSIGLIILLLFVGTALSADLAKPLTFTWDQATTDLPNLQGWGLYVRATAGGAHESLIPVPYTGGNGPFLASQTFTVTGNSGTTIRKFFVLDAVSKSGNRSGFSNEVFYDFVFPYADVTTPMSLKVTAAVQPQ